MCIWLNDSDAYECMYMHMSVVINRTYLFFNNNKLQHRTLRHGLVLWMLTVLVLCTRSYAPLVVRTCCRCSTSNNGYWYPELSYCARISGKRKNCNRIPTTSRSYQSAVMRSRNHTHFKYATHDQIIVMTGAMTTNIFGLYEFLEARSFHRTYTNCSCLHKHGRMCSVKWNSMWLHPLLIHARPCWH